MNTYKQISDVIKNSFFVGTILFQGALIENLNAQEMDTTKQSTKLYQTYYTLNPIEQISKKESYHFVSLRETLGDSLIEFTNIGELLDALSKDTLSLYQFYEFIETRTFGNGDITDIIERNIHQHFTPDKGYWPKFFIKTFKGVNKRVCYLIPTRETKTINLTQTDSRNIVPKKLYDYLSTNNIYIPEPIRIYYTDIPVGGQVNSSNNTILIGANKDLSNLESIMLNELSAIIYQRLIQDSKLFTTTFMLAKTLGVNEFDLIRGMCELRGDVYTIEWLSDESQKVNMCIDHLLCCPILYKILKVKYQMNDQEIREIYKGLGIESYFVKSKFLQEYAHTFCLSQCIDFMEIEPIERDVDGLRVLIREKIKESGVTKNVEETKIFMEKILNVVQDATR